MKRFSFLGILIVMLGLVSFVSFAHDSSDLYELKEHTEYLNLEENEYSGEKYIKRRFFEDKKDINHLNKQLYEIINSQQAIMKLMDTCGVKEDVFVSKDVKYAIASYRLRILNAYKDLSYGLSDPRFEMIDDDMKVYLKEFEGLKLNYLSKSNKRHFYGVVLCQHDNLVQLINLYNE